MLLGAPTAGRAGLCVLLWGIYTWLYISGLSLSRLCIFGNGLQGLGMALGLPALPAAPFHPQHPRHLSHLSQPCPPPGTAFPSRRWDPPGAVPVPLTGAQPQLSQQLWGRAVVLSNPQGWGAVWGRDVGTRGQHSPSSTGVCCRASSGSDRGAGWVRILCTSCSLPC